MATKKPARFYLDWWTIEKRTIRLIVSVLIFITAAAGASYYVWAYGIPFKKYVVEGTNAEGARFIAFEGDVRVVRATTRETVNVTADTRLYPGDTVQTGSDGRARVTMADGSVLVVRPNSTVIVRDNARSENGLKTNVQVALDDGKINVRTENLNENNTTVVETSQTRNKLDSQTEATFGVNSDTQSAEIRINQGRVETTTNNGEKTVVNAGEYVAVNSAGTVAKRERLLNVPQPSSPRDLAKIFVTSNNSASITLSWQRPPSGSVASYRVEVASSPFFVGAGRVTERDKLESQSFHVSDLKPGTYFWRVRANATSGQVSEWSEPLKFIVAPRGEGDAVSVQEWRVDYLGGSIYVVSGRASPGTNIIILGRSTPAGNNGSFQLQVSVPAETQELAVEARDADGNSSRYSLNLNTGKAKQK
jgi:uncharacterized cupin superfamily protein